jgi:hypothetical protein
MRLARHDRMGGISDGMAHAPCHLPDTPNTAERRKFRVAAGVFMLDALRVHTFQLS